jgi:hypothetical protein
MIAILHASAAAMTQVYTMGTSIVDVAMSNMTGSAAGGSGGALYVSSGQRLLLSSVNASGNSALESGGSVSCFVLQHVLPADCDGETL